MSVDASKNFYPLGIPCGRKTCAEVELKRQFQRKPLPKATFFRHLLADHLRQSSPKALTAGELELLATINQVLRRVAQDFFRQRNFQVEPDQIVIAGETTRLPELKTVFSQFVDLFPILPVELQNIPGNKLVATLTKSKQVEELLLEIILVYVQSQNRALKSCRQLFVAEEQQLQQLTGYRQQLHRIDQALPRLDDDFPQQSPNLLQRLIAPLQLASTLSAQLRLLQDVWAEILPPELLLRISAAFKQYEQEGFQPGPAGEPELSALDPATLMAEEYADFTIDHDWMPRTVLVAKSTYVWLEQLSKKYKCWVKTLDQIPDAELDELVGYGFTSLWLIGIWQRSNASLKVKQASGQVQVAASAYAVDDYRVAGDLGGDDALENLRGRCRHRGLDLACDVVTNHTGIESALLRDHPDWFVQLSHPPYPGYRFNGADLSEDPDYSMQIEDGYYDHSEAAVVCRYQQRHSGEVRYIYHGNDGTHLPWNDTAQLNYLMPEVREAMIRLIIDVAKRFRIIRFDAAMTLAKKHFQRLWYPLPGGGAGVPSRSDHALSQDEFNRHFPIEFWRELVDRIRIEAPDTLLVAEAFWLMEGYFVRTLGMHRVYNSAFMNMLKQEENGKYRQTIKNILSFDPAILQRFVNFMSNPDEKPAIEQFGNSDKYFCVATLLVTMPGLPMFGHGQVEGLHEKYGMEYLAPRWQEQPDLQLISQHENQIFPLLRKRALFSGSERFQLYDFASVYGVEEDVFAYSNSFDGYSVLTVCNNSPKQISGKIGSPAPMADKEGISCTTACAVDLAGDFVLMTDICSGLQFLQPTGQLREGGSFNLEPYCHRVLTEFRSLVDNDGRWQQLWHHYGDGGRRDLLLDHAALLIEPTWKPLQQLLQTASPHRAKRLVGVLIKQIQTVYSSDALIGMDNEDFLKIAVQVVFPWVELDETVFADLAILLDDAPITDGQLFKFYDRFFNHRQLRKLLKCNYYQDVDWFGQLEFGQLSQILLQYKLFVSSKVTDDSSVSNRDEIITLLRQLQQMAKRAGLANYQVDTFLQQLDQVSTATTVIPVSKKGGMKILFVASEATPFAKSGGLADVAGSLPRALRKLGHDVRIIIPAYQCAEHSAVPLAKGAHSVEISLAGVPYRASLKQAVYDGVPYLFVDTPEFFDREQLYGTAAGDYQDNGLRFGFFARAVLELVQQIDFKPDLIHLHDWQTGLIPPLLCTDYSDNDFFATTKTLLTIHNLGYQGMFPLDLLNQLELSAELGHADALEYYQRISFLKGAINLADMVTTVSPTYSCEVQESRFGHGFDGLLRDRRQDFYGIINGLDQRIWNPDIDPHLTSNYTAENLRGKSSCKKALQQELGLEVTATKPIIVVVSRLDQQKGINLLESIWGRLLQRDVQFVLLGSGSQQQMEFWQKRQNERPKQVSINLTFDEPFSHRLYSAADMLLVPSLYEPCGLTQMIALTYGALPIVRRTGGLADTVVDIDEHPETGYGFVFDKSDPQELLRSIDRALELYAQRRNWVKIVKRGMLKDFSWGNSAEQYQELYLQAGKADDVETLHATSGYSGSPPAQG